MLPDPPKDQKIRTLLHRLIGAVPPPALVASAEAHRLVDECDSLEASRRAIWDAVTEYAARRGDPWSALLLEEQEKEG